MELIKIARNGSVITSTLTASVWVGQPSFMKTRKDIKQARRRKTVAVGLHSNPLLTALGCCQAVYLPKVSQVSYPKKVRRLRATTRQRNIFSPCTPLANTGLRRSLTFLTMRAGRFVTGLERRVRLNATIFGG